MSKVFLILTCIVAVAWIYFLWSRRRYYKVYWQLKGPLGLPFLGISLQVMRPEKYLKHMEKMGQEYKTPYITWLGSECFLYVNDPETLETIFNSPHCTNKGDFYRFIASAIGDGLFTSSSPRWNKHRRLINPAFGRQVINKFLPIFNNEANTFLNKLLIDQGKPLEIFEILKRCVLEASCQTTMGQKMNFQNDGSEEIFKSYNSLLEVCIKRIVSPWLYSEAIFRCSSIFKAQQKYVRILYTFVENLLEQHIQTSASTTTTKGAMANGKTMHHPENYPKADNNDDGRKKDEDDDNDGGISKSKSHVFVKQVRNHIEEGQLTWQDVRDEANVIVAATFETTSTALYLICLCLAMHPEYQDKLYNELKEIFPGDDNEDLVLTDITLEQLERMTFTEMVMNEGMRLFAPVPMILRTASEDFQLRSGTLIPQGTQILIDIYNMQRSEKVWGPYAQTFNPEKHFGDSHKPHPFAFVPFTKGLRMCIGYRYALMLMKVMLAKIFRNFRLHTDAKMPDLIIKGTVSLKLCQYPLFVLEQRKSVNAEKIN